MIPKVIHYIWFSNDEKPEQIKKCMESWKKVLPDYEIKAWGLSDVAEIRKDNPYLDQALNNKKWSWASDFLRLWILYNKGGIYLDTDVEVLKSFDPFLHHGFFTCYEQSKALEAAVMGAEKGNRFAKEFLDLYKDRNFEEELAKGVPEIIPFIIADYICEKYKVYKARNRHTVIDDLHIYPYKYFSHKSSYNRRIHKSKKTVCIHQFANTWIKKTKRKLKVKLLQDFYFCFNHILTYKSYRKFRQKMDNIIHKIMTRLRKK